MFPYCAFGRKDCPFNVHGNTMSLIPVRSWDEAVELVEEEYGEMLRSIPD